MKLVRLNLFRILIVLKTNGALASFKEANFVFAIQLLLMKRGGRVIYGGKLGVQSQIMIDYFQVTLQFITNIVIIITTTIFYE